jgi:ankyrin repeat protein
MWDLEGPDGDEQTRKLIDAIRKGRAEDVFNALEGGANPNGDIWGTPAKKPALMEAVMPLHIVTSESDPTDFQNQCSLDIVEMLLDAGADIARKDQDWKSCLHLAAGTPWTRKAGIMGDQSIMGALIAHVQSLGLNLDVQNVGGCTPLHYAAQWGNAEHVKALSQAGADINHADKHGETPLHHAAKTIDLDMVKALVSRMGADKDLKDQEGKTPKEALMLASTAWFACKDELCVIVEILRLLSGSPEELADALRIMLARRRAFSCGDELCDEDGGRRNGFLKIQM